MKLTAHTRNGRRVAALVALIAAVAFVGILVSFLWGNVGWLLVGLVGFPIFVLGAWGLLTERGWHRVVGGVGVAVGFGLGVWGIVAITEGTNNAFIRLLFLLLAGAIVLVAGRVAVRPSVDEQHAAVGFLERRRPQRPVLICNRWSGGGKVEKFGIVEAANRRGVETVMLEKGDDLRQLAEDAVDRGAEAIGMAGGDGSQALVASVAIERDVPFVCIPAGTRNHFALDLALDVNDPSDALEGFVDGVERRVDYATVGDRLFVNNVSLGLYARIVQEDSYRDAKRATASRLLPQMLGAGTEPFDLRFDLPTGEHVDGAHVVLVSNNPYELKRLDDMGVRRVMDSGVLGVVVVRADTGLEAAALALGAGRQGTSGRQQWTCEEFVVQSGEAELDAGVDGEALMLPAPIVFRIHPLGLRLLVPEENPRHAYARRHGEVTVGQMFRVLTDTDEPEPAMS